MDQPVILFDGVCNFCNALVRFILRQDKNNRFLFCQLQSPRGKKILEQFQINRQQSDSFVLIENNKAYLKSSAALRLYGKLPWYWKWTQIFWIIPEFIRDAVYAWIAKNRYRWFGKKQECMIPRPEWKTRFIE